ncbi:hypothetical protein CL632_03195 [bacterium]|jgi:hypothetical protein|nr:hypothetical protein [bacterium]|tara:strand:- start:608 stop:1015 length:408 start_codon:yes stop_codon:yes gene_type:complete
MKKRGQATLWFLIELIAAIFIIYMAVDISLALAKGIIFEKRNIARDISMQINTLSGLPGDGYIINKNLHGYSLQFFENKVSVFEVDDEPLKGTHSFVTIGPDLKSDKLIFEKPDQIIISKKDKDITILDTIPALS